MKVQADPQFQRKIKKLNVRIQKSFKEAIKIFKSDPLHSQLDNHALREEWEGFRSIDITNDYRAIYEEIHEGDETVAYFVAIGTHQELYKRPAKRN